MSVLLFPPPDLALTGPDSVEGCAWLTALGAVATAEVVATWTGRQVAIKWPNDVRVAGRKIAGILVECPSPQGRTAVIGIGLNVNVDRETMPVDLRDRSTSIQIECGGRLIDRSDVASALIRSLDHWYGAVRSRGRDALTAAWRDQSEHLGQVVRVATPDGPHRGRLVDLDVRLGLTLQREEVDEPRFVRIALAEILALDPDSEFSANPGGHWTEGSMSS